MVVVLFTFGVCFAVLPWWPSTDTRARKVVALAFCLLAVRYLLWRLEGAAALHWSARTLLIDAFLAFEFWGISRTMRDFNFFSHHSDRRADADAHAGWFKADPPFVDLLIPTYNESPEVLRRAIVGAMRQDYSNTRVWVLDDGRRPWLKEMAESRGARYLTRKDNQGYKAGNLNNALKTLSELPEPSVFFAVVDCDFVSGRSFITRSLSLMHDPLVAVVQTKQVYYNEDMFQYGLRAGRFLPDWLRFGFEVMLPAKDAFGSAHCCGTSFLGRTRPFLEIGGFPTQSLAEDQLATMALRSKGHRTVYLADGLTFGILAEGLAEFLTQRFRWCLGVYQNLFSPWGPFSTSPKPLRQRIRGAEAPFYSPLSILARIFMHYALCAYWFLGYEALPLPADPDGFIAYFIPVFVINTLGVLWLSGGTELPVLSDARLWVSAGALLRAMTRGLLQSKNFKFDVTDKNVLKEGYTVHWGVLTRLLFMIVPLLAGMAYGTFYPFAPRATLGAYLWSLYALSSLILAAAFCIEPPQRRAESRFPAREVLRLHCRGVAFAGASENVSLGGLLVQAALPAGVGVDDSLRIEWHGKSFSGRIVRVESEQRFAIALDDGPDLDDLCALLYSDRYVQTPVPHKGRVSWAMFRKMVWDQ